MLVRVPGRLEQAVVEAGREHRERRPLAEEVVDAVDAPLRHDLHQLRVQRRRAVGVVAERLLEREHGVLGQVEVLQDRRRPSRRRTGAARSRRRGRRRRRPAGPSSPRRPSDRLGRSSSSAGSRRPRHRSRRPARTRPRRSAATPRCLSERPLPITLQPVEQPEVGLVAADDEAADAGQEEPLRQVAAGAEDEHRRGGHAGSVRRRRWTRGWTSAGSAPYPVRTRADLPGRTAAVGRA